MVSAVGLFELQLAFSFVQSKTFILLQCMGSKIWYCNKWIWEEKNVVTHYYISESLHTTKNAQYTYKSQPTKYRMLSYTVCVIIIKCSSRFSSCKINASVPDEQQHLCTFRRQSVASMSEPGCWKLNSRSLSRPTEVAGTLRKRRLTSATCVRCLPTTLSLSATQSSGILGSGLD